MIDNMSDRDILVRGFVLFVLGAIVLIAAFAVIGFAWRAFTLAAGLGG